MTDTNVRFRQATPTDVEALYRLKIEAFADEFALFDYGRHSMYHEIVRTTTVENADENHMMSHEWHTLFCSLAQHGYGDWSFVGIVDGAIVAAVYALPGEHSGEDYAGIRMQGYNVLLCVYVHPEYKNKGIGEKAAHMEQQHPDRPWILDTPEVSGKNQHFYPKCGYRKVRLEDGRSAFIKDRP